VGSLDCATESQKTSFIHVNRKDQREAQGEDTDTQDPGQENLNNNKRMGKEACAAGGIGKGAVLPESDRDQVVFRAEREKGPCEEEAVKTGPQDKVRRREKQLEGQFH